MKLVTYKSSSTTSFRQLRVGHCRKKWHGILEIEKCYVEMLTFADIVSIEYMAMPRKLLTIVPE